MLKSRATKLFLVFLFLLSSCQHTPTRVVFHDKHTLIVQGRKQVCSAEIRSDASLGLLDPNDETSLQFRCEDWKAAFTRELNSCLVDDHLRLVRWLNQEKSLLLEMRAVPDHGGPGKSYLLFNFETRQLQSDLYGLPAEKRCHGSCYQSLVEKVAQTK